MCCPSRTFLGRRKKVTMMSSISSPAFRPFDVLREFTHNPFTWFKGKGLLLAAGDRTQCNAMTIGWGALGNSWVSGNATLTVYVTPKRYTYALMERARYFTVMSFDEAARGATATRLRHSDCTRSIQSAGHPILPRQ